ncbi:hypothetical protein ACEPAI_5865 [Sanghuangporus weigelae]
MSAVSTPTDSPIHAEPLHHPERAAKVVVPQAPLGNATNGRTVNQQPGMGAKALLAKTMAKSSNPKFISPTDSFQTPVSSKINAAKKKRFNKGGQPPQGGLFQQVVTEDNKESGSDEEASESEDKKGDNVTKEDPENPF